MKRKAAVAVAPIPDKPGFFRDLLSDDHGHWDIGYVSMFVLIGMILGVIPLMCGVMLVQFIWYPDGTPPIHRFDVLTLGKAVALITGAFTGPLAALAAYILAMKQRTQTPPALAGPVP
jgi:hypothetical protein